VLKAFVLVAVLWGCLALRFRSQFRLLAFSPPTSLVERARDGAPSDTTTGHGADRLHDVEGERLAGLRVGMHAADPLDLISRQEHPGGRTTRRYLALSDRVGVLL